MLQPKPKFDPSQPFSESEGQKPKFNPNAEFEEVKKKDNSNGIVADTKSVSAPKTGSSVGKSTQGFPEIDTNSVAPGMGVQPGENSAVKESKTKLNPTSKPEKERGFVSEVYHKLATGSSQLGADIAAVPELLYDAFSMPQNAIADYFDIPSFRTDSEKFKKTFGVKNAVKDYYKNEVSKLREESARVDKKYEAGIYDSFKNGNVADGFRQLTNSFAESLPATSSIMLGGAYAKAPQLLAASTMVFGANKNEQLKDENPDMSTNARVVNALGTGLAEGAFETIGSGSIGAAARGLVEREGKKKAVIILKDGLVDFYKEALKKNPLTASMTGEGLEEWATQVTQNSIDVATGAKPKDYNVFEGATDAFISGVFGGAVFGGGLKGIEKVVNVQDRKNIKANTNTVFALQNELEKPDVSETTKAEIHKSIDDLIAKNQQLIQNGVKNIETLSPHVKAKLEESISTLNDIKTKAKAIELDGTSEETKKVLLENLKSEAKEAYDSRNAILEGKTTEVDVLPLKEQEKLKKQAMEDLVSELNPDGSKDITISNEQVVARANEILKESRKNESNKTQTSTPSSSEEVALSVKEVNNQPKSGVLNTDENNTKKEEIPNDSNGLEKSPENNETVSPTNTTADGNIQSGTESNDTQGQNNGIQETIDTRASKIDTKSAEKAVTLPKIDDIADFIKQTYLNDGPKETESTTKTNQGTVAESDGENSNPSKTTKRNQKQEVKLDENGFVIVSKKGKTPLNERKFKGDRKTAVSIEPSDVKSLVLSYFAKGGKIASDYFTSPGELKARNNGINGIATKKAQNIDMLAHTLWESQENSKLKFDTSEIKNAIEDVVNSHNTVQDIVGSLLKYDNVATTETTEYQQDYFDAATHVQEKFELSDEQTQEMLGSLDLLSDAEIIELAEKEDLSFGDYVKELEKRQVSYDFGPFSETGTIQPDGYILSETGDLLHPESVSNVKQLNPEPEKVVAPSISEKKYVFTKTPSLSNAQAIDIKTANISNEADIIENIIKNDGHWNKVLIGGVTNKGNGWFEVGKTVQGESVLHTPTTNETVVLKDAKNKGGLNGIYVNDFVNNNPKNEAIPQTKTPNKTKSPELEQVEKNLEKANEKLRVAKEALDRKAKSLDKEVLKDNEDLFGDRKSQNANKLFDERVNPDSRNKATEKERQAIKEAQEEVKKLSDLKAKIESGEVKSTKELEFSEVKDKKQQLKEKANEEVDKISQKIKDLLPGIKDPDLHTQGTSQDQLIDLIASAVKALISKGIDIHDAVTQVVESIKAKFGDIDIDIEAVKERINPKKEPKNDFVSKQGKKSLLNRLIQGGNPDVITKALEELGGDYYVRNQEAANEEAMSFIDKVGASEALKAVQDGLIKNSDIKILIYDEALTRLKDEISTEIEKSPEDREALIQKFQELSDEFDNAVRDAGQGISILNYIYNKNETLKYNLKKQIADYKRNSPDGKIPDDIKAKFEELDAKLKDLEERTKLAEERAKKAEDELAVKNIQEDIARKKQLANKNKSGLTPREQTRKKELRNKFFGRLNDATSLITMLADPEFREYLGLTLKQAKGDFQNFSQKIINELGKGAKNHLPQLFEEAGKSEVNSNQTISIGKDGKIKIPAQMLRDYVEAGETDIDVIAQKIKEAISEEYPDVELRDIRDALTGYGKQINPNKDEITAKVNRLKEYGRLLSAYEDVLNGEMPKKSGLVREKAEQKSRELRKKINRLAKELELESVDLEKQWATAIDKVKSNLKNQIEDLDKQIANGEKRKVERTSIKLDAEAEALKAERNAKRKILDEMTGKPELTEEQKIANAERLLEKSIEKLQKEIDENDISFKEKPTPATSVKIESLKSAKKALLETRKKLREETGLIEEQRLKTAKTRVKNQIEDLKNRIETGDFAKKEVKPILADNELNTLRAEKEALYEEFEKLKYIQELANRTTFRKYADAFLEATALTRAIKASLDLGLIGIQLRGFTYSELWRNPVELGRKFAKLFGAIGSQSKTDKSMSLLIGHPLYALSKKLDIGITHPDLRNEVREEMASGNLLHVAWNVPIIAANMAGKESFTEAKRKSIGDTFIDAFKRQINKMSKNYQLDIKEKEKFTRAEQWRNINVFEAIERGLSTYGNQMRFEEFVRGVDRLKKEGKDEINHKEDYEALASYIRTFSGRAKPPSLIHNQKALNVFFFSFKNAVSVFQQLNPYYMFYDLNKTNLKNGKFKPTVAGKMAMATMFKSVSSTAATMLFMMAGYNAFKDDDDEEMTIENDPRSSDFGKLKIGDLRYDPWGGYVPLITLYARLLTEETKLDNGIIQKLGSKQMGLQSRGDAMWNFGKNKFSPGFQMFYHYITSKPKLNKQTGEIERVNSFGKTLSEDEAFSLWPIFLGSVRDAVKEDPDGVQSFLTAYSILGLGNVQKYESKTNSKKKSKKFNPEEGFQEFEPKEPKEMD